MGGLNCIVFTAGIGENDPPLRRQCLEGLEYMGVRLDVERNAPQPPRYEDGIAPVHADDSSVHVLVIATDEELMIARDTAALLES